jgi:hypothetical protein
MSAVQAEGVKDIGDVNKRPRRDFGTEPAAREMEPPRGRPSTERERASHKRVVVTPLAPAFIPRLCPRRSRLPIISVRRIFNLQTQEALLLPWLAWPALVVPICPPARSAPVHREEVSAHHFQIACRSRGHTIRKAT